MYYVNAIYNSKFDKLYIGQTINIDERLIVHNNHKYGGYTSGFQGEWVLIHKESVATRSEALIREKQLKSFRGRESLRQYIPE